MNFNAYNEGQQKKLVGLGFNLVDTGYFQMSLASGQAKPVTVTRTAPVGWECTQATVMTLNNPTDPIAANNIKTITN